MHTVYTVCGLLVVLLVCGAQDTTTENNCVSSYEQFLKETFNNNSENRYNLYQAIYPQNGHLSYVVYITYWILPPNGTKSPVTVKDSICPFVEWRWISSPVFIFITPETLNYLTFYTLNYFRDWQTPSVNITVPYPCPKKALEFLASMTSLVDIYALGQLDSTIPSGNVIAECEGNLGFHLIVSGKEDGIYSSKAFVIMYLLGGLSGIIVVLIGSVLVLKWNLKDIVNFSYTYSYKQYGLWWGVTYFLFVAGPVMFALDVKTLVNGHKFVGTINFYGYTLSASLLVLTILPGFIIAGYFTYKTKPPAVPYILMIPVAALLCCCHTQRAKSLVFGTALWINLTAVTLTMVHGLILFAAALAEPFAVITNTLVLILVAFCITNILALLFTISAYLFTPKRHRPQGQGKTMLRAVVLIPLLAMIACLCFTIGSIGYLIKRNTKQDNIISLMGSVALPVILGAVTLGLKKLMSKWLNKAPNDEQPTGRDFSHDSNGSYEMLQE